MQTRALSAFYAFCCLAHFSCKPTTPESFQIEQGFTITRVAVEPLIKDPVDLEFNERGDAMVLEMPGYPFEDKQSRIVVLKDKDADGVYDDKIIFIENLQLANSFMPYEKGVLVAAPPYLLFVHDEDQNYLPEKVDTLMGGFSTGNLQHNYNGLTLGLDNWIYAANGGNDGAPFWWNDTTTRIDLRGQDFRFHLETKRLERISESSGGFGLAMDEYGHIFETHNLEHISHPVFSDRYYTSKSLLQNKTLQNISDHEENGLARIYPIGKQESRVNHPEQSGYFSGACGITYYGGGAFGEEFNNTVWVADVVLNLIHVDKINPKGSSFTATRMLEKRDFLASTDRSFRPVNMTVGPDGALYIVDMHRKVIEHPEWIPDDIEKTLDLEAGKDQGRIYRITKTGTSRKIETSTFQDSKSLVKTLAHPNQWMRKTAHRLLLEKPLTNSTIDLLKSELTSAPDFARLHSLWLLHENNNLDEAVLIAALQDSSPNLRENALIIAESQINNHPELLKTVLALLSDSNSRVRMQAALSVSTISREIFNSKNNEIVNALQASVNRPGDTWNTAALTLAAQDQAALWLTSFLAQPDQPKNLELLNSLAFSAASKQSNVKAILTTLANSNCTMVVKRGIIKNLSLGIDGLNGKSLEPVITILENSANNDIELLTDLATLRNKLKLPVSRQFVTLSRQALKNVLDKSLPDSMRLRQMAMIEMTPYREKSNVLFACLHSTEPLYLQENALRQLSKYQEKEIGQKIVSMWPTLSPHIRRYASDLLLYIEIHHDALLGGIEKGIINIGEMNFDLERRQMLLWWTNNEDTKRRAEKLFSDSGVATRQEAIETMKPALSLQGSALQGAKVFETVCANCHIYGALGKEVGPVLTEISRKSKETLMHDILDPNAAVDTKYINHRLETQEGSVHIGIVGSETDQQILIKKMGGENVTVMKKDVKSLRSLGTSLMMEGLENSMTHQEMADLLEFLQKGN